MAMLHEVPWDDSCSTGTMNVLNRTRVEMVADPQPGLCQVQPTKLWKDIPIRSLTFLGAKSKQSSASAMERSGRQSSEVGSDLHRRRQLYTNQRELTGQSH